MKLNGQPGLTILILLGGHLAVAVDTWCGKAYRPRFDIPRLVLRHRLLKSKLDMI